MYVYILSNPKNYSPFFEHLYLPFKMRFFKSVCCRRSLNLCIIVG